MCRTLVMLWSGLQRRWSVRPRRFIVGLRFLMTSRQSQWMSEWWEVWHRLVFHPPTIVLRMFCCKTTTTTTTTNNNNNNNNSLARRQTPWRHHDLSVVEGQAAGMIRHSLGHVCRRPATQPWKQELQPVLPPSTRPTNTANYRQLTTSPQWPLKQPVPGTVRQLSWSRNWEGGRLSSQETPERPPTCYAVSFQNTFTAS